MCFHHWCNKKLSYCCKGDDPKPHSSKFNDTERGKKNTIQSDQEQIKRTEVYCFQDRWHLRRNEKEVQFFVKLQNHRHKFQGKMEHKIHRICNRKACNSKVYGWFLNTKVTGIRVFIELRISQSLRRKFMPLGSVSNSTLKQTRDYYYVRQRSSHQSTKLLRNQLKNCVKLHRKT